MKMDFESVYREYYQRLYTFAFRMTGNIEDSEEILQTAFINAFKAYDSFEGKSSVYTWLYKIVHNAAKNYYKKSRRLPAIEYSESHGISQQEFYDHINSFGKVEEAVIVNLTRETCLQMFMNCMPPKYRAVYTLRVVLDLSTKETAEVLEISENAVKVNLYRARKITRDHIDGRCSLIQPGAMCACRNYAGFLVKENKQSYLSDIQVVYKKEKAAVEKFTSEIKEILQIDNLYKNQIKAPDYAGFKNQVKQLMERNKFKVLGA